MSWKYKTTLWWARGTLPVTVATQGEEETLFLPCNPIHQSKYPDFIGYIEYKYDTINVQLAVVREGKSGWIIKNVPLVIDEQGLTEVAKMLITESKASMKPELLRMSLLKDIEV